MGRAKSSAKPPSQLNPMIFMLGAAVVGSPQARPAFSAGDARPDLYQVAFGQAGVCIYLHNPAHHLMPQNARIGEVPVALLSHFDIRAADGAGYDLQQGSAFGAQRIGQIVQLQEAGAF